MIECDGHTYGLECKMSCGNCFSGEPCDHVTGSCSNRCDNGFYGDKCDIGIRCYFKINDVLPKTLSTIQRGIVNHH